MNTIVLPGYSVSNKEWAENVKKELEAVSPVTVVNWLHWETGKTEVNWVEKEAEKIINSLRGEQVNLLTKSIGTVVAMVVLRAKPELINKIIFCGVPLYDLGGKGDQYYRLLKNFQADKFLCFQNENDHHGSFKDVEQLLHSINSNLKVISKPRSDHEYPYPDEFIRFLT
jgi:predicted alpha/beta hydrolase family esterase